MSHSPKLCCEVLTCEHNAGGHECKAREIRIDGCAASCSDGTCCETYRPKD